MFGYAQAAVAERLNNKTERSDFMTNFLRDNDTGTIPRAEIESIFTIVALAGCESPATALSGATYYLLRNPPVYKKLQDEVRSLPTDDELTIANLSCLPYLRAVLKESLRVYPAVPAAMDRVVPPEGRTISGHFVPGGTWVGVPQLAANHSTSNFVEPHSFIPERYMEKHDPQFDGDNKTVVQPFSTGPRNCIGLNLAKAEMKLILAKIVWHFDMELVNLENDWTNQHIYGLWDKNPLMVRLMPRGCK
jgi:cytochrome P450